MSNKQPIWRGYLQTFGGRTASARKDRNRFVVMNLLVAAVIYLFFGLPSEDIIEKVLSVTSVLVGFALTTVLFLATRSIAQEKADSLEAPIKAERLETARQEIMLEFLCYILVSTPFIILMIAISADIGDFRDFDFLSSGPSLPASVGKFLSTLRSVGHEALAGLFDVLLVLSFSIFIRATLRCYRLLIS